MMCNLKQTDNPLIFQGGFARDKGTKICGICESVMCIGLKVDSYWKWTCLDRHRCINVAKYDLTGNCRYVEILNTTIGT